METLRRNKKEVEERLRERVDEGIDYLCHTDKDTIEDKKNKARQSGYIQALKWVLGKGI